MAEYSRIAKGHFTSTGFAQVINLPFRPELVEFFNYTVANSAATSQNIASGYWDVSMGQGTAVIEGYNATPALIYDTVATNGISTFAAGQLLQYGPLNGHGTSIGDFSITAANPAVVTTTNAHGLQTGNVIVFENLYQTSTTGMVQFAGIPMMVTVLSATTFSLNWNASGSTYAAFSTATSTGNVGTYKQVLYPYLYAPGQAVISAINTSTNTITTTAPHNFVVGQEVGFRIPTIWGSTQLNELPNVLIPGSPLYYYVTAVTQTTFTVAQSLAAVTAFNVNFNGSAVIPTGGWTFAQVVAAGDFNTGGWPYTGGNLYPSPLIYNGAGTTPVPTINGPAIQGAFVNNTSQGFIIGAGTGRVLTTGNLVGASTNVIYWKAMLVDLPVN
jgi:hypothetical protein